MNWLPGCSVAGAVVEIKDGYSYKYVVSHELRPNACDILHRQWSLWMTWGIHATQGSYPLSSINFYAPCLIVWSPASDIAIVQYHKNFLWWWTALTLYINSCVITNNCRLYSNISKILLLYKHGGMKTNQTLRNQWGYVADVSNYHNAGIWSMD